VLPRCGSILQKRGSFLYFCEVAKGGGIVWFAKKPRQSLSKEGAVIPGGREVSCMRVYNESSATCLYRKRDFIFSVIGLIFIVQMARFQRAYAQIRRFGLGVLLIRQDLSDLF